ncbi:hypothetical protein L7F22_001802 [Adiantum nelumboides]|nr:hypothetical protein [Adiantum nelumboides]
MVHLEFKDPEEKSRAERYRKVIANTCKKGLGLSVNVKISLAPQPVNEELLASPLPLLAESTQEDRDREEGTATYFGSEQSVLAKSNTYEAGTLQHWQRQSRMHIAELDYPAYNLPSYDASVSSLSVPTQDKAPPSGSDLKFIRSEAVLSQETQGLAWAGRTNELVVAKAGYWQDSPDLQKHTSASRCSESVKTKAIITLNSEAGQHAERSLSGCALPNFENKNNSTVSGCKQESRRLEAPCKYEMLLCCRVPIEEDKPPTRRRRRRCRALISFIPCGYSTR